ncbi:GNAT family N-acetyltransferase [Flindersiella endophytica]
MDDLERAVRNAAALWTALAEARGNEYVRTDGLLVVEGGRRGRRVMMLSGEPADADVAEAARQATLPSQAGVTVEDSFGTVDLTEQGLVKRQLAVMIRHPAPLPALRPSAVSVSEIDGPDLLTVVERIGVDGFPLETFQPYEQGTAFPAGLLDRRDIRFFLAEWEGEPAGITVIVEAGGAAGVYWVTTLPDYRSRGIARAMMHTVLERYADRPATLTSATAARPLYESLGFQTLTMANWWIAAAS